MNRSSTTIKQDFYNLKEQELQRLANEFSEGNIYLEKTLLTLWQNNIKTQGCCNGHGDVSYPYINLLVDGSNIFKINNIIKFFIENDIGCTITFCQSPTNFWISISMNHNEKEEKKNKIFQLIEKLANQEEYQIVDPISALNNLSIFCKSQNLVMKYNISKEHNTLEIKQPFHLFKVDDINKIPNFKNELETLKESGSFTQGIYICSEENLKELANIIAPTTYSNSTIRR